MQHSTKSVLNEKRQLFKKEAKAQKQKRDKTHKKHGKIYKTAPIKPQKREKKPQKANIPAKNTGFCRNILKKTEPKPRKNLRKKSCTRLKLVKAGKKALEYAQKCLIKSQSGLISTKKHLKSAVNYYESHLKVRLRGKYEPKVLYFASEKNEKIVFKAQNSLVA